MSNKLKFFNSAALITAFATATTFAEAATSNNSSERIKLLTADFEPRQVVQVEAGDFHFLPGQVAPIHTHSAPAIGYVTKGTIIYQVEGEKPQILQEGDAFFEPVGPRILRFDNASATEEAIFVDFNLEQAGEPFIVFESSPTEAIDRRSLPTFDIKDQSIKRAEVFSTDIEKGGSLDLDTRQPTLGLVAHGIVEIQVNGVVTQRIAAGASFALPADSSATLVNASAEVSAKVITFLLR